MVTASVISGSSVDSEIVFTPVPGMLNLIVSAPALLLASVIACRSEPAPESLVLVTVKSAACAGRAVPKKNTQSSASNHNSRLPLT